MSYNVYKLEQFTKVIRFDKINKNNNIKSRDFILKEENKSFEIIGHSDRKQYRMLNPIGTTSKLEIETLENIEIVNTDNKNNSSYFSNNSFGSKNVFQKEISTKLTKDKIEDIFRSANHFSVF
jgi:hypothetical protein